MTAPPRKYAEAPGTASSAAEIKPPAEDSAIAIVSFRSFNRAASAEASGVSSFMASSLTSWGAPTWPPTPPTRSSRPGIAGALLDSALGLGEPGGPHDYGR